MVLIPASPLDQLDRSFRAFGSLIDNVRSDQWDAPTPCTEWSVRRLVHHVVGMNLVFAAMLAGAPPPQRDGNDREHQLRQAYPESAGRLLVAFAHPGALERTFESPLGSATGLERLQIRLYDLLAHGWDLAQATGQAADLPVDAAESCLAFVRGQLRDEARPGRFAPPQVPPADASALERLAAFLGRPVT